MANIPSDTRPSPEALLEEARKEGRGRLKIFLGAAPGVGKTYAMLEEAQQQNREGGDIVVGLVETHGRTETEHLLQGLEILPRRALDYRGRDFLEMDLDAILKRCPRLVLVDELAHTNIPGSRHLKRYQDVDELLDAGIDVWSTLNVQHLESLNDVIERIAGIKVRETLPDSVLQSADEIKFIDTPPKELLKRLAEGKVYVPEQAHRAMDHFFSPGNLTALREMALRQAAERVDAQMLSYMRTHAIAGPWPTRERILVCLGDARTAQTLVRKAKRAAERRQAPWVAVYVETHRHLTLPEGAKDALSQALRLAEQLGGETAVLPGEDVATELLAYARARNVSQIIVGRPAKHWWFDRFRRTVADDVLARGNTFDIVLVASEEERADSPVRIQPPALNIDWRAYGIASAVVAATTGIGFLIDIILPVPNIVVAHLVGVLLVAIRYGLGPSIYTSLASFLAFNFFFTEPRWTFVIADVHNIGTVLLFLIAAVITSNLAVRLRRQVEATKRTARRSANLYEFSKRVAAAAGQDDVLWAVVHHVASTVHGQSLILLPQPDGRLAIRAGYPPEDRLDEKAQAAADWAWSRAEPAGSGSATLPTSDWLFLPLRTARGPVGVLGVQITAGKELLSPDQSRLLDILADQAAVAIERTTLVSDIEAARVATEAERLRSALLSSLSHDLRTPLVSILGAASSLISYGDTLSTDSRTELAQTIQDEAERLNRFVQNLLDMTRLGSGALKPRTDWVDVREIVGSALERAEKLLHRRPVRVDLDPELPLLCLDFVLMEQVFFNLFDNACKYAPANSRLTIWGRARGERVVIEVCDQGPGIPEADREQVFDMFYRVQAADSRSAGTGLGLAICRGIIKAHGGTISVQSGLEGCGTCIVITLPAPQPPEQSELPEADEPET